MKDQVKDAVEILTKALKDDEGLYYSYQSNIAMAFKDEYARNKIKYMNKDIIHKVSNQAAKNFLDLWIKF